MQVWVIIGQLYLNNGAYGLPWARGGEVWPAKVLFFFRSHCLFVCLIKKQGHCCQLGNTHFRTFIFLIHWIDLQSQTKIVGILATNAVFFFRFWPVSSSSRSWLSQLTHQHWEGKKTAKCPNNLDWDYGFWKKTKHENNHNGRPIDRRRMTTSVEGWGPRYKYRGVYLK